MHILNGLWTLIQNYWLDAVLVIAAAIVLIKVWKNLTRGQRIKLAKRVVSYIEVMYKAEAGQHKKNLAIAAIKKQSWIIDTFFTDNKIDALIEEAFVLLNKELDKLGQEPMIHPVLEE